MLNNADARSCYVFARPAMLAALASVVFALLANDFVLAQSKKSSKKSSKKAARLEPTPLSLRVKNRPVSDVLKAVTKKTGNDVQFVNDFGRPDSSLLSTKITFQVKKVPFWEVMTMLEKLTGATFIKMKEGAAHFAKPNQFNSTGREPSIGAPQVSGAIRAAPRYNKFFHNLEVQIQPEPRLGSFAVGETKVTVTPKKGEPFEIEQDGLSQVNGISNCVNLAYDLEVKRKKFDLDKVKSFRVKGHVLRIERNVEQLGTIAKLLKSKKEIEAGLVKIQVTEGGIRKSEGSGEKAFYLKLQVTGPLVTQSDFVLAAKGKEPFDLVGGFAQLGGDDARDVELEYDAAKVGKKAKSLLLSVKTPTKVVKVPIDFEFKKLHEPKPTDQ